MAVKHYVDEVPPSTGRTYEINGTKSTIKDVTKYDQVGSGFGAKDVNAACVLECNYAKSDNVHLLTTDNVNSENIKFYATAAYTRGDTFKFNNTVVTAKTIDGRELETNFFVASTMVECIKRGNALYFQGSSSQLVDDVVKSTYHIGVENGVMYIEEAGI